MDQETVNPLELIATDDLVDELFRRYSSAAFVGQRESNEHDLMECLMLKGQERIIQGLCMAMVLRCDESMRARTGPSEY